MRLLGIKWSYDQKIPGERKRKKNRQKGLSKIVFKGGQIERPGRSNLIIAVTVINKGVRERKREKK